VADLADARRAVAALHWWHAIEVVPGLVTPGGWDLRPTAERIPWPPLTGRRCLDVGTMDGFWAFELERRGAAEVVASDLVDPADQDPYTPLAEPRTTPADGLRGRTFRVAADLLGSRARYVDRNVYDLDPAVDGEFDVVFMGYVLQMLRDPLRALERVRSVCRGHLLLLDTVSVPLTLVPAPVARLDARRDGREFFVFNRRGLVQALRLTGWHVEAVSEVIRDHPGPGAEGNAARPSRVTRLLHATGVRGRSIAVRARRGRHG
jgi:tRNA (mo5U34)-methyltransferase